MSPGGVTESGPSTFEDASLSPSSTFVESAPPPAAARPRARVRVRWNAGERAREGGARGSGRGEPPHRGRYASLRPIEHAQKLLEIFQPLSLTY